MLRDELREAVGDEAAETAERRGALDEAVDAAPPKTVLGVLSQSRAVVVVTFLIALVFGAVIALVTGAWWFVLVALVLHALATTFVVATALSAASEAEHADPRTVAALEARGVADPDAALNRAIGEAADAGDPVARRVRRRQREITPRSDPPSSRREERS